VETAPIVRSILKPVSREHNGLAVHPDHPERHDVRGQFRSSLVPLTEPLRVDP
jgi:hypothetical protein